MNGGGYTKNCYIYISLGEVMRLQRVSVRLVSMLTRRRVVMTGALMRVLTSGGSSILALLQVK